MRIDWQIAATAVHCDRFVAAGEQLKVFRQVEIWIGSESSPFVGKPLSSIASKARQPAIFNSAFNSARPTRSHFA